MFRFKTLFILCFFLQSGSVFSGEMGKVDNTSNWDIYGSALYLQSNTGALNIAGYTTTNGFDNYIVSGNIFGLGFKLGSRYQFQKSRDIDINWYAIDNKNNFVITGPMTNAAGVYLNGPEISTYAQAKWNAVNLELAQQVDSIKATHLRFHAGVTYAALKETLEFFDPGTGTEVTERGHITSYIGFGPRIGIDANYNFANHFFVYSNTALGILAGTSRENGNGDTADNNVTGSFLFAMLVVPELEERLGVKYAHSISNGSLSLDAGWMWINYFQALITRVGGIIHEENFGFQGPYLGLKWSGNVA